MMVNQPSPRMRRMMDLLQREVAKIIREELDDPNIGQVTVTDVRLAKDFSTAKIYISSLQESTLTASAQALNHAKIRVRAILAERIEMRRVPEIHFAADRSIIKGDHIVELIDENIKKIDEN